MGWGQNVMGVGVGHRGRKGLGGAEVKSSVKCVICTTSHLHQKYNFHGGTPDVNNK